MATPPSFLDTPVIPLGTGGDYASVWEIAFALVGGVMVYLGLKKGNTLLLLAGAGIAGLGILSMFVDNHMPW